MDPGDDPHARIRRLWLATMFVSCLGSGMVGLATSYIVYEQTGSVSITGLIAVCWGIPPVLLASPATRLAARLGGPDSFVIRYLLSAVVTLVPAVLAVVGDLGTVTLLLWNLALGTVAGLFSPSSDLVRRMLAPPRLQHQFNSAVMRNWALSTVIGIAVGGVVLAAVGPAALFFFDVASYVLIALPVIALRGKPQPENPAHRARFRDAFTVLRSRHDLRAACVFVVANFAVGSFVVTLPAIARQIDTDPRVLAALQAGAVVGGIVVTVVVRWLDGRVPWGRVQRVCFLVAGAGLVALAVASQMDGSAGRIFAVCMVAVVLVGFARILDGSILNASVQASAPDHGRAAFFTLFALLGTITVPLAQEIIGLVADTTSVSISLGILGGAALVLFIVRPRLGLREDFDRLSINTETPKGSVLAHT